MMFEFADEVERLAVIKVAGIGGAGGNAVGRMIEANLTGVEFLAVNTDLQALKESRAHNPLQIGAQLTKGLGSGGNPSVGEAAAEEDRKSIAAAVAGSDMVFVTAGMGGGTGTGAASVVADIARDEGALTVGIVTRPFLFEGHVRGQQAEDGIARLKKAVDTLIVIPNQRLLEVVPPSTSMQEAFRIADNVLYEATRGIYEIITRHDHVNLDFADVRSVMKDMGVAIMGTGRAEGENRAVEAAKAAISSPLLEDVQIAGSKAVLVNVLGREVELHDTAAAMQFIQDAAGPEAHVIFGYGIDESLGDTLQVTVIATGFRDTDSTGFANDRAIQATRIADSETTLEAEPAAANEAEKDVEPEVAQEVESATATETEINGEPERETEPSTLNSAAPPKAAAFVFADEAQPPEAELPAVPERQPDVAAEPESVSESVPAPELVRELEPEFDVRPEPGFLTRSATAGGGDQPVVDTFLGTSPGTSPGTSRITSSEPESDDAAESTATPGPVAPESEAGMTRRFLRRVGRRNIGEVEVPDSGEGPVAPSRSVASGLRPGDPNDDLTAPAYTRKYMD